MNNTNELQHWGIPGMKWGVRRYQNKDGSLTPAGRKRADKLRQEYLNVTGKKLTGYAVRKKGETVKKASDKEDKKKSIKDMTDEELRTKTQRMTLEKNYIDAKMKLKDTKSEDVSLGRKAINAVAKEMITPAAINIGKQVFNTIFAKTINDTFKIEEQYKIHTNNRKKDK